MRFPSKPEPTDFQKFINLLDEWGLVNRELNVYQNEQTQRVYVFNEVWTFDKNGKFLFIEDVEYDTFFHRGGEVNQFSGREYLHED